MSMNLKAAALLAVTAATLFSAGSASAEVCDGSIQQEARGRTRQCYYLPTVSNGRVTGVQKQVNVTGYNTPYGNGWGRHPGAVIGGAVNHPGGHYY